MEQRASINMDVTDTEVVPVEEEKEELFGLERMKQELLEGISVLC